MTTQGFPCLVFDRKPFFFHFGHSKSPNLGWFLGAFDFLDPMCFLFCLVFFHGFSWRHWCQSPTPPTHRPQGGGDPAAEKWEPQHLKAPVLLAASWSDRKRFFKGSGVGRLGFCLFVCFFFILCFSVFFSFL